jgi:hypothetical protein
MKSNQTLFAKPAAPNPLGFLPLREFFSLDLRSLALLRVCLAVIVFVDWSDRLHDLRSHYSDAGIVPRNVINVPVPISLHFFSGAVWFQAVLAIVAMLFAVALFIGWRTPVVTLVSWFLLLSVQARNPPVMQGGDQFLRLLLFWGIFLPLGARWSLDAAEPPDRPQGNRVLGPASVALIIQICLVYWFAAAWKWAPEWRDEGSAVYIALQIDHFTTPFGRILIDYPQVLRWLTYATLYLETLGPVLLFLPFYPALLRLLAIGAFVLFHAGLAVTLELSNFPWVCMSAWLTLLPTAFWEGIAGQLRNPERNGLKVLYDPNQPWALRRASRLLTFLFLSDAPLLPAETKGGRGNLNGRWSVVDFKNRENSGLEALAYLVRLSPVFGPLAGLVKGKPASWIVRQVGGGPAKEGAPARPTVGARYWTPPGGMIAQAIVVFCLAYIILWNIRTLDQQKYEPYFPDQMQFLGTSLGLDQGWGLFAPSPGKIAGWYFAVGIQKDGNRVNLLKPGEPINEDKPELVSAMYSNGRWRKLMMNLPDVANYPYLLPGFARYFMEKWNRDHHGDEEVIAVEVHWMQEKALPPGQPKKPATRWDYRFPPQQNKTTPRVEKVPGP